MGGKNKTVKSTEEASPWVPQQGPLKFGFKEAERLYKTGGPKFFGGNTVAGFAPQQEDAFRLGTQRATQGNQTMRMAEGFNRDVLSGKYSGDPYEGQVFQNMQQRIMPAVNSQFMNSGRYGSGLQTDTATRALTESFAPYASNMYQRGIDRMGQAASMAPTFAANDYADLSALQGIGSQIQGQNQAEIDADRERFDYEQNLPFNNLQEFMKNIGGTYGGTVVSSQKVPQPSKVAQGIGMGLQAIGTMAKLAPLMSDERVKDDIRRVGAMDDGTAIYAYRYKGSPVTHFGVLAQEVEKTHPHTVVTYENGLKAVDYSALADVVSK